MRCSGEMSLHIGACCSWSPRMRASAVRVTHIVCDYSSRPDIKTRVFPQPASRQRMQRLADELASERLVEFIDNPRHRRSKLVRLTRKGDAHYRELSARFLAIASTMGADLSEPDIRKTIEIARQLSDETKGISEQLRRRKLVASAKGEH